MNILFITYYFPPCNSIASNRTASFYKSLIDAGHNVTVVTRGWDGNENTWADYIKSSQNEKIKKETDKNNTIFFLPYKAIDLRKSGILRKIGILSDFILGNFNQEIDTMTFYQFCSDLIEKETFEYILISSPPINSVKLGYKLKKAYPHLKLIFDFRDLQNHILLPIRPIVSSVQRIEHFFIAKYLKKWLAEANHLLVASEPFGDFLSLFGFKSTRLLNGYERKIMVHSQDKLTSKFSISVLGTLYPHQELDFFISTLKGFVADKSSDKVVINLIGVNAIPEVARRIEEELSPFSIVTNKLPRNEALDIGRTSSVLAYPGWKDYRGMYSGKLFEYLALKRPIFIGPTDNDVIEKIVNECEAGKCVASIVDGIDYLNTLYNQWGNNQYVFKSNEQMIAKYSREEQNKALINLLS